MGAAASPLVSGWTRDHQRLTDAILAFEVAESGLIFSSGYAACMGTIAGLAEAGDLILSDQLNHASLIDGCRLAPATVKIFPHIDVATLVQKLERLRPNFDQCWIVTDAVFSMDGTTAPLAELCDVADRFDASLIVDEAHATGVLGPQGRGWAHHLGVHDRIPVRIGTLSKAIGLQGGFVVGPEVLMERMINRCRPFIYSTALTPLMASKAAELIRDMHDRDITGPRRSQLHDRIETLRKTLSNESACMRGQGIRIPGTTSKTPTPILPLVVGSDLSALDLAQHLESQQVRTVAIRPPTVPEGSARIRISLSALHTNEDLDRLVSALKSWAGHRGRSKEAFCDADDPTGSP